MEFSKKNVKLKVYRGVNVEVVQTYKDFSTIPKKWYEVILQFDQEISMWASLEKSGNKIQIFDETDISQLQDGLIGFYTYATSAAFDKIRMEPLFEPIIHPPWPENPEDLDENSDLVELGPMTPTGNGGEDPIKQCMKNKTPEQRGLWCDKTYDPETDPESNKNCYNHFCITCCARIFDEKL